MAICASARAQSCSDPRFDVASVKPVEGRYGLRPQIDGARVHYPFVSLTALILKAFAIKSFQLDGPKWLGTAHYEVTATIPEGCGAREIPAMIRRLLVERFSLKIHEEARLEAAYGLVESRSGANLKKSDPSESFSVVLSSSGKLTFRHAAISELADALSGSLGRPVIDMTGIGGEYDMELDVDPPRPLRISVDDIPDSEPSDSRLPSGLRSLGLKLERRKATIQHFVIDEIRKIPTPN